MQEFKTIIFKDVHNKKSIRVYESPLGRGICDQMHSDSDAVTCVMADILETPMRIAWVGEYTNHNKDHYNCPPEEWRDIYALCYGKKAVSAIKAEAPSALAGSLKESYIINHTKKMFINMGLMNRMPGGMRINPLPLLTACGNGRSEDYEGTNMDFVGSWALDEISCSFTKPEGYEQLFITFSPD